MRRTFTLLPVLLFCATTALAAPVVLFDEGHGQAFTLAGSGPLQLSELAALFAAQGVETRPVRDPLTAATLAGAAGVVLSGPFAPYHAEELDALVRYVEQGGRLAVMLHIGPPLSPLLARFGVIHSNGVVREEERVIAGEALNFRVVDLAGHPLTRGLESFSLYGAWALLAEGAEVQTLARTGPQAWVDLNQDKRFGEGDVRQAFAVAVTGRIGEGEFVVFADDALFQNGFLEGENRRLAENLVRWLAGG